MDTIPPYPVAEVTVDPRTPRAVGRIGPNVDATGVTLTDADVDAENVGVRVQRKLLTSASRCVTGHCTQSPCKLRGRGATPCTA